MISARLPVTRQANASARAAFSCTPPLSARKNTKAVTVRSPKPCRMATATFLLPKMRLSMRLGGRCMMSRSACSISKTIAQAGQLISGHYSFMRLAGFLGDRLRRYRVIAGNLLDPNAGAMAFGYRLGHRRAHRVGQSDQPQPGIAEAV